MLRNKVKLDPARIRLMRHRRWSWHAISDYFGVSVDTVRCAVDPAHKAKLDEMRRQSETRRRHDGKPQQRVHHEKVPADILLDRDRRMSIVPTVNQAILGDPLPGRSALDKRRPHLAPANVAGGAMCLEPGTYPGKMVDARGKTKLPYLAVSHD